ncbi:Glucosyltransferase-like protein [Lunasporangiospora selenospora]|uniref:Alpha-1,3-glucosyltransferase n=1 Tax=Lunasporangiospora selenospora TaxID=979761 RepID=A0A9P6KH05_9FUNG|nr:Glucosyltransferase-like protein [Lunasporangiospora selenospora]
MAGPSLRAKGSSKSKNTSNSSSSTSSTSWTKGNEASWASSTTSTTTFATTIHEHGGNVEASGTKKSSTTTTTVSSSKLSLAVHRYSIWLEENQLKRYAPWIAIAIAVLVRCTISLGPYSGLGVPPRFGDYEAQRHWMELTLHRPVRQWYSDKSKWWDLDYPPLTAYVSWICGYVTNREKSTLSGNLINPEWYAWETSRGYESQEAKLYMRATVLVCDLVVYLSGVIVFVKRWFDNKPWTRQHTALILILLQPGLILIDHGHFQYNSVMLGFVLWAVACFLNDQDVLGSIFFCLALGFKQMALYFSPAVFSYLLGKSLRQGFFGCIWKLIKLGIAVILTLGLLFSPWLQSQEEILQVINRIFPVFRGLYQDKVANVWCAVNVVVKIRDIFDTKDLLKFSTLATLLAFLPSCLHLLVKPTKRGLIYSMINASLSFFLLSFQVHEKSILIPALPVTLLILDEPAAASLFNTMATFSMFPLLRQEALELPYFVLIGFWIWMTWGTFKTASGLMQFAATLNLLVTVSIHLAELLVPPPARYPDIYPVLNSLWNAAGFGLYWIFFNYRQFTLVNTPKMGLRVTKPSKLE